MMLCQSTRISKINVRYLSEKRYQKIGPDRFPDIVEKWSPESYFLVGGVGTATWTTLTATTSISTTASIVSALPIVFYWYHGLQDVNQQHHTIKRNFPLLASFRYILESIRPEIQQYFIEHDHDDNPFSRERRALVYRRAKNQGDTLPFGSKRNMYAPGMEWMNHSMFATSHITADSAKRVVIGGSSCTQPYSASIFNISAMSYGALSDNAVLALNGAAAAGGFYHNTGEGGLSPVHFQRGGDLVWQIGTGYFGCRDINGDFDPVEFKNKAAIPQVKMIELKISQGAKPGHGGILPAGKITPLISKIRGIPMGQDCLSPGAHTAFSTPTGLIEFIGELRKLSDGKPIGFKLCIGDRVEFLCIIKAMLDTGILPDFITVDGGEGGTGAAPVEFSNHIGSPLLDGLHFVNSSLHAAGLRTKIRVISSGKISDSFSLARMLALGADLSNSARGMMFALGCIQALKCDSNKCPTGIATQDPKLTRGLHVPSKTERVTRYHAKTVESCLELVAAAGLKSPHELRRRHITRRISHTETKTFKDIYPIPEHGCLLNDSATGELKELWKTAKEIMSRPQER